MALDWQNAANGAREGRFVESQARKVLNDILERVGEDKIRSDTAASFLKDWLKGKDNPGTAERYGHTVELFKAHLGRRQQSIMTAISHKDILGFMEARRNAGAASKTISVDLKALNTAFNFARKLGFISSNPVEKALALKPIEVESSEKDQFTAAQVQRLLKQATGDWLTLVLLGYYTGARLSDCANMEWSNAKSGSRRRWPSTRARSGVRPLTIPTSNPFGTAWAARSGSVQSSLGPRAFAQVPYFAFKNCVSLEK